MGEFALGLPFPPMLIIAGVQFARAWNVYHALTDEITLPLFRPAGGAGGPAR